MVYMYLSIYVYMYMRSSPWRTSAAAGDFFCRRRRCNLMAIRAESARLHKRIRSRRGCARHGPSNNGPERHCAEGLMAIRAESAPLRKSIGSGRSRAAWPQPRKRHCADGRGNANPHSHKPAATSASDGARPKSVERRAMTSMTLALAFSNCSKRAGSKPDIKQHQQPSKRGGTPVALWISAHDAVPGKAAATYPCISALVGIKSAAVMP